ncbi:nucleolar rRNA processing-related protein [Rhodotorula sp. JG-1b]|nr:nucleolar rRNA processing-related protein [Rhodotorula sp. JG-1b]
MVVSLASTGGAAKIYCVNGGGMTSKNAAAWLDAKLTDKNKRRKKGGQGGTGGEGEIRLIQDFDFPEASNKIKTTRDGKYLLATGTYKPRMKVFDLEELSMKMERVTDSENVDFCILSSDWMKTLHLQSDRSLELHTQAAAHYRVRMPRQGRTLAYHFPTCDALVGGSGPEVWRMNLEVGRFMKPFGLEGAADYDGGEGGRSSGGGGSTGDAVTGVNAIDINPAHQLMCFGTETVNGQGTVEMWDPRSRARAGILRLPYASLLASSMSSATLKHPRLPGVDDALTNGGVSVTALANRMDGLNLAVGTSTGHVLLYDLRANRPYTTKDQGYGLPVKKVEWVESAPATSSDADREGGWVASADEKVVKIWGKDTGNNLVAINPPMPINDLHIYPGTGLVFLANETSPMTGYYIPQLGPAPKWCRFLDNMTEEMEDDQETLVYDDYKFVDRQELDELNLGHLIGTDTLKPYMHGFFVDLRLYTKARAIANPFQYAEHRDKLIRDKLAAEQESRIRGAKKVTGSSVPGVKVNKSLAKKLRAEEEAARKREAGEVDDEEDGDGRRKRKKKQQAVDGPNLLQDNRFADIFTNPDFEIDEESREFMLLNPSGGPVRNEPCPFDEASDDFAQDLRAVPKAAPARSLAATKKASSSSSFQQSSRPRPTLVAADDSDDETLSHARARPLALEDRAKQTFAQRTRQAAGRGSDGASRKRVTLDSADQDGGDEIIRGAPGGGMEMSFGMGLERTSGGAANEEAERELEGDEGSGRTKMRKPMRSASRNKTRFL